MTTLDLLHTIRRKWFVVVAGVIAGLLAGWLSAPGAGNRVVQFEATHVLLLDPQFGSQSTARDAPEMNFDRAALLVTAGEVPTRVAATLGVDPVRLVRAVRVVPDADSASLAITARNPDPAQAEVVAQLLGDELIQELIADDLAAYETQLAAAQARLEAFQQQLTDLDNQIALITEANDEDPALGRLGAERDVVASRYAIAFGEVDTLIGNGAPRPPLLSLQAPEATRVKQSGLRLPDGRPQRALALALVGLLAGAVGAVVVSRLDIRIRDKNDAEQAFGLPVLAEIPVMPDLRKNDDELLALTRPASPFVEAYRALRTVVLFSAVVDGEQAASELRRAQGAAQHGEHRAKVVLVTSPLDGEAKTTTAAHLATLLGEVGKRVLIVSADFRRPRLHALFGVPVQPGLTEVLSGSYPELRLSDIHMRTPAPNVWMLPSGTPIDNPAPFLREAARLIAAARDVFDFVIVDTAPLLVANDATELAGVADMVVLMARAGRTTRPSAKRAHEMLARVDAPVLGVVLVGTSEGSAAYGYYTNRYYPASTDSEKERVPADDRP